MARALAESPSSQLPVRLLAVGSRPGQRTAKLVLGLVCLSLAAVAGFSHVLWPLWLVDWQIAGFPDGLLAWLTAVDFVVGIATKVFGVLGVGFLVGASFTVTAEHVPEDRQMLVRLNWLGKPLRLRAVRETLHSVVVVRRRRPWKEPTYEVAIRWLGRKNDLFGVFETTDPIDAANTAEAISGLLDVPVDVTRAENLHSRPAKPLA